ncbi:MAG: hypothetical protein AB7U49_08175 [Hyphomicrobiaceae bacterium]
MTKTQVKFSDDPKRRNTSIILTCEKCRCQFHPRIGAHIASAKYCSPICARKAVGRRSF